MKFAYNYSTNWDYVRFNTIYIYDGRSISMICKYENYRFISCNCQVSKYMTKSTMSKFVFSCTRFLNNNLLSVDPMGYPWEMLVMRALRQFEIFSIPFPLSHMTVFFFLTFVIRDRRGKGDGWETLERLKKKKKSTIVSCGDFHVHFVMIWDFAYILLEKNINKNLLIIKDSILSLDLY